MTVFADDATQANSPIDDRVPTVSSRTSRHERPPLSQAALKLVEISSAEVVNRLNFLGIDEGVSPLGPLAEKIRPAISKTLAEFYELITSTRELDGIVQANEIPRLMRQVTAYWHELFEVRIDARYAASRMRVGVIHDVVGLELQWYLAGLSQQTCGLLTEFPSDLENLEDAIRAFLRIVFLDMTFVVDAYMDARAQRLVELRGLAKELVQGVASAVAIVDSRQRVLFANELFVALVGVDASLLYNMDLTSVVAVSELEASLAKLTAAGHGREVFAAVRGDRTFRVTLSVLETSERSCENGNCGYPG
ncbi:MAG: hypothetical protein KDB23_13435 [Planctomycetales bacterium]|nr:hypothetical protein [Planctomycetales bacterium]